MIIEGLTLKGRRSLMTGESTKDDVYKIALYSEGAELGPKTKKYITAGEVRGRGYVAGGITLTGYQDGETEHMAYITWTGAIKWANADIEARAAVIYNASKGNVAITVFDFGSVFKSSNGPFVIPNPPITPETVDGTAMIQWQ